MYAARTVVRAYLRAERTRTVRTLHDAARNLIACSLQIAEVSQAGNGQRQDP